MSGGTVRWPQGIRPGSETVTIKFADGPLDSEAVAYFGGVIADYFEGATVTVRP